MEAEVEDDRERGSTATVATRTTRPIGDSGPRIGQSAADLAGCASSSPMLPASVGAVEPAPRDRRSPPRPVGRPRRGPPVGDQPLDLGTRSRRRSSAARSPTRRRAAGARPAPTTSANSPRAGIVPSPAALGQLAQRAPRRSSRGASSAPGRPPPGRSAPHAAARSRSVAADPARAPRTATVPRSSAAIRASRSRRSRPDRGRNPSNVQRGPATPDARRPRPAPPTRPGSGTTDPPSAAQAATRSPPGSLTRGRAGIRDEREVGAAAQVLEQRRGRAGAALSVVAGRPRRRSPWRSSSRRVSRVSSAAISGTVRRISSARSVTSAEVPDRRRDDVQRAGRRRRIARPALTGRPSPACRPRPPTRIEVVDARRPRPELGDRRHLPLELGRRRPSGRPARPVAGSNPSATISSIERRLSIRQNSSRSSTG